MIKTPLPASYIEIKAPHDGTPANLPVQAFTEMCQAIHHFNTQWWLDPATGERKDRNVGEMLMLSTSELAEALEAHRKNLQDSHLSQYHGVDVELVDCVIRVFDLLGARYAARIAAADPVQYSPGEVFAAKCLYNAQRADHRPENRLLADGKKY